MEQWRHASSCLRCQCVWQSDMIAVKVLLTVRGMLVVEVRLAVRYSCVASAFDSQMHCQCLIKHLGCSVSINNTIICQIIIINPACDVMLVIIALLDPAVCSVDSCMCAHCVFTTQPADAEDQKRRRQVSSCGRVRMKAIQRFHIFFFLFLCRGRKCPRSCGSTVFPALGLANDRPELPANLSPPPVPLFVSIISLHQSPVYIFIPESLMTFVNVHIYLPSTNFLFLVFFGLVWTRLKDSLRFFFEHQPQLLWKKN